MSMFDSLFGDTNGKVPERTSFSGYHQVVPTRPLPQAAQEEFEEERSENRLDVQRRVVDVIHAGGVPAQADLDLLKIKMVDETPGKRVIPYESHTDEALAEEERRAKAAMNVILR